MSSYPNPSNSPEDNAPAKPKFKLKPKSGGKGLKKPSLTLGKKSGGKTVSLNPASPEGKSAPPPGLTQPPMSASGTTNFAASSSSVADGPKSEDSLPPSPGLGGSGLEPSGAPELPPSLPESGLPPVPAEEPPSMGLPPPPSFGEEQEETGGDLLPPPPPSGLGETEAESPSEPAPELPPSLPESGLPPVPAEEPPSMGLPPPPSFGEEQEETGGDLLPPPPLSGLGETEPESPSEPAPELPPSLPESGLPPVPAEEPPSMGLPPLPSFGEEQEDTGGDLLPPPPLSGLGETEPESPSETEPELTPVSNLGQDEAKDDNDMPEVPPAIDDLILGHENGDSKDEELVDSKEPEGHAEEVPADDQDDGSEPSPATQSIPNQPEESLQESPSILSDSHAGLDELSDKLASLSSELSRLKTESREELDSLFKRVDELGDVPSVLSDENEKIESLTSSFEDLKSSLREEMDGFKQSIEGQLEQAPASEEQPSSSGSETLTESGRIAWSQNQFVIISQDENAGGASPLEVFISDSKSEALKKFHTHVTEEKPIFFLFPSSLEEEYFKSNNS